MILAIYISSAYRSGRNCSSNQISEPIVDMYLDSIGTGPITQKQLMSVKKLVVISNGVSYGIKSFDLGTLPNGGPAQIAHCFGANLSTGALEILKNVKPKDMIIIGNLKVFNLEKFRQNPHTKPLWTVVANSK
jgi:hypothetical protein